MPMRRPLPCSAVTMRCLCSGYTPAKPSTCRKPRNKMNQKQRSCRYRGFMNRSSGVHGLQAATCRGITPRAAFSVTAAKLHGRICSWIVYRQIVFLGPGATCREPYEPQMFASLHAPWRLMPVASHACVRAGPNLALHFVDLGDSGVSEGVSSPEPQMQSQFFVSPPRQISCAHPCWSRALPGGWWLVPRSQTPAAPTIHPPKAPPNRAPKVPHLVHLRRQGVVQRIPSRERGALHDVGPQPQAARSLHRDRQLVPCHHLHLTAIACHSGYAVPNFHCAVTLNSDFHGMVSVPGPVLQLRHE